MKSYKNRIVLSLVLAGSVASCSTGVLQSSTEEKNAQRRERVKKALIISSAAVAVITAVYLFDKYGMEKLDQKPLFSNKVDEFAVEIVKSLRELGDKVRSIISREMGGAKADAEANLVDSARSVATDAIKDVIEKATTFGQELNDKRKEMSTTPVLRLNELLENHASIPEDDIDILRL